MSKRPGARLWSADTSAHWARKPVPPSGQGPTEARHPPNGDQQPTLSGPAGKGAAVGEIKQLSLFYGYPAELVARWCGVSVSTAAAWKANKRKPSRQALRIFTLHRDGRVLGDAWDGWEVRDGVIRDPEGNVTTARQLRHYAFIVQLAAELASRDPQAKADFERLLARA